MLFLTKYIFRSLCHTSVVHGNTVWRETFEGENFHEFRDFSAIRESFLHEILGMPHPLSHQFLHSAKVFSAKCSFPTDPRKFSPSKISRYTVLQLQLLNVLINGQHTTAQLLLPAPLHNSITSLPTFIFTMSYIIILCLPVQRL